MTYEPNWKKFLCVVWSEAALTLTFDFLSPKSNQDPLQPTLMLVTLIQKCDGDLKASSRSVLEVCKLDLLSPGDEEDFAHRPGILHLHKSVMVDAFCVSVQRRPRSQSTLCAVNSQSSGDDMKAGN